jgi:hypothetical protein
LESAERANTFSFFFSGFSRWNRSHLLTWRMPKAPPNIVWCRYLK